jgi:arsenate reductase
MAKQNVLFLCTGNSTRSVMAEALLRDRAGDRFHVLSAGTAPRGVNPLALRVLREIKVNTDGLRSKSFDEYVGRLSVRYLIVVCAAANRDCPIAWPGVAERVFWWIEDPATCEDTDDEPLDLFREARDEIDERIRAWLAELQKKDRLRELVA